MRRLVLTFLSFITICSLLVNNTAIVAAVTLDQAAGIQSTRATNDVLYSGDGCGINTITQNPGSGSGKGSQGGPNGGCGSTNAEENKKQVWNFLKSKGLNDGAAAGIMGNMEQESGFMPTADNNKTMGFVDSTGRGCRGIVQWCHERNEDLDSFAAERGQSWDCLGTQLDYMWYEMTETEQGQFDGNQNKLEIPIAEALNGGQFGAKSKYNSRTSPYAAAQIFHDYFERANTATGEDLGRGDRAEDIYRDFTGQEPPPFSQATSSGPVNTSTSGSSPAATSSGDACPTSEEPVANGVIPSEECAALIEQYKQLKDAGKIKIYPGNDKNIEKDLENCTTDQIECGTGGGKGGVHPKTLRALVAAAANSGAGELTQWNFNTGHGCDGKNHPKGLATDIYCNGNNQSTGQGASEDCNKLFKYFYDNYDALGLTELIWQYPPSGYSCGDPKILCNINDHDDHIHVGTRV